MTKTTYNKPTRNIIQITSAAGCMRQVLGPGALGRPRGIRWRRRWEEGSGWGIHVSPWLIPVNVWQKPLQYCKEISLQLIKINGKKKKRNIILNGKVTETISPMISNKTEMFTLATFTQHSLWSPSHANQRKGRNKRNRNWKRSKTVSVCRWRDTINRKS